MSEILAGLCKQNDAQAHGADVYLESQTSSNVTWQGAYAFASAQGYDLPSAAELVTIWKSVPPGWDRAMAADEHGAQRAHRAPGGCVTDPWRRVRSLEHGIIYRLARGFCVVPFQGEAKRNEGLNLALKKLHALGIVHSNCPRRCLHNAYTLKNALVTRAQKIVISRLVGRAGLEPATNGLKVRCSTD